MSFRRLILVIAVATVADRLLPPRADLQREVRLRRRRPDLAAEGRNADDDRTASREADERGCAASSPAEISPRGWKNILLRVVQSFSAHRIMSLAAGMTYYGLLAIFPALAALVAIYGVFSDASSIAKHLDQFSGVLPGGAIEIARDQLTRVASKGAETLGFTFVISLAISLWSANAAVKSLFDTLNIVYGEDEKRSFITLNAISLVFTLGGIALAILALTSIVIVPIVLQWVGLSRFGDLLLRFGRWPAMLIVLTFALAVVYRYGPSREAPRWRWMTWGSGFAALLGLIASGLFSFYAANFGNFNETYGSLGAVIGFMTWLWISAIVILLGAELDAEMERDTATRRPRPISTRGACVADRVGQVQG